ncbi:MAG: aldehyde ferredoxin oxidoreductase family protein, partial [Rhodospirillales bacterium]|nr:aldehyde ferredoxin oxidoreductase family protein [Rhodospirillales bacterium]
MSWQRKVLRVNLTDGTCSGEPLNMEWANQFLGQRGLATKYLYEEVDAKVDPLAPGNKLIFATGPLTGTNASTSGRFSVATKGANNNAISASNSGGYFGAELKLAGWDMLIVEGCAKEPVYLLIYDDVAKIIPAGDIWGRSVWDTEDAIKAKHQDQQLKLASIGRAGELGVKFACVINDLSRAAGRSGTGAVMGSKNLKAVAVRGTVGVSVDDPKRFLAAAAEARAMLDGSPQQKHLSANGTIGMMNNTNGFGSLPTRNCRDVQFEGAKGIDVKAVATKRKSDGKANLQRNKACFGCTLACGRVAKIDPEHFSLKGQGRERYTHTSGGLEYENSFALGAMVGVDDLDAATFANFVCDEHGMDTISFGVTLAAAMELYETGAITDAETGMPLNFGSAEALVAMVEATALGEGFGKDIGLGAKLLCEKYGHPEFAMVIKGQEIPGYDPRAMQGIGLSYATNNRGACHNRGSPFVDDFAKVTTDGKVETVFNFQNAIAACDSSGTCSFTRAIWQLEGLAKQLDPALEGEWTPERLLETGERIWNLERLFNLKAGFTRADDTLPKR